MTNAAQNDNWSIMRRRNVRPAPPLGKRDVYKSCGTTTEEGAGFGQPCLGANVLTAVRNPARYPEISRQWKDLDTFPRCNESSGRHFMKYWGGGARARSLVRFISPSHGRGIRGHAPTGKF